MKLCHFLADKTYFRKGLYRMRRIGIKTGIRIAAIALIAFPEPITTALGILILAVTFAVCRQKNLNKFGDLEVLAKRSMRNTEVPPLYNPWFDNRRICETVLHHTLKTSFPQYEAVPEYIQKGILKAAGPKNKAAIEHHKLGQHYPN